MATITVPLEIAGDALSTSTTILTPGTLSADNVILRIPTTAAFGVTAVVTGISFLDIKTGAPVYTAGAAGASYIPVNDVSFPQTLRFNGSSTSSAITISVSALGQECASGAQTLVYVVSLSSQALSGNPNRNITVVDVANTTDTSLTTKVTATNTEFAGRICQAEWNRLRYLEAC